MTWSARPWRRLRPSPRICAAGVTGKKTEKAAAIGLAIAERCKKLNIDKVVFDRAGFRYHGRIKAIAEAARKAGLQF